MTTTPAATFNPAKPEHQQDGFRVRGIPCPWYVGHAPEGGVRDYGDYSADPFCYIYAGPIVLTADRTPREVFPELNVGDVVEMQGYGLFRLVRTGPSHVNIQPV